MVGPNQLANAALEVALRLDYALASKDSRSHPEIYVNPFR